MMRCNLMSTCNLEPSKVVLKLFSITLNCKRVFGALKVKSFATIATLSNISLGSLNWKTDYSFIFWFKSIIYLVSFIIIHPKHMIFVMWLKAAGLNIYLNKSYQIISTLTQWTIFLSRICNFINYWLFYDKLSRS